MNEFSKLCCIKLLFTSCIVTSAASKQGCTLSQQMPAALTARREQRDFVMSDLKRAIAKLVDCV
ncbi:MAG: hypothetical protein HWQ44_10560 [Nostoc sp. JL34]|nr:hypothetical protein [Nostoc sp. JL34]